MKLDDFKQHVAKSQILSDREARDLLTLLVGIKPDRELPFVEKKRTGKHTRLEDSGGKYTLLEFPITKVTRWNTTFPGGVSCRLAIDDSTYVEISEVEFCNPADFPIDDVQIDNCEIFYADKIEKIPEKLCMGNSVYKAVFTPPAKVEASKHYVEVHFKTKSYSGPGTIAKLCGKGSQTVTINGQTIEAAIVKSFAPTNEWNCLLGLKMKTVDTDSDSTLPNLSP